MLPSGRLDCLSNLLRRQPACRLILVNPAVYLICQFKHSQLLQHSIQNFQARRLHPVDFLMEETAQVFRFGGADCMTN